MYGFSIFSIFLKNKIGRSTSGKESRVRKSKDSRSSRCDLRDPRSILDEARAKQGGGGGEAESHAPRNAISSSPLDRLSYFRGERARASMNESVLLIERYLRAVSKCPTILRTPLAIPARNTADATNLK